MLNAESVTVETASATEAASDTAVVKKGGSSKKAFDFSRNSIWALDPLAVCVAGGKAHHGGSFTEDEASVLDTADTDDELYRDDLNDPLDPVFVESVRKFWVQDPILIGKRNGVAVVVEGRTRVRTARLINAERARQGLPSLKVEAKQTHDHFAEGAPGGAGELHGGSQLRRGCAGGAQAHPGVGRDGLAVGCLPQEGRVIPAT